MRPIVVLRVHLERLTEDLGLWCNDCRLSTGIRVWFTSTSASVTRLRSVLACTEYDGDDITDC